MAARTDAESTNTDLTWIEAEFTKFMAAHTKTDVVIKKLHTGQNKVCMHAHTVHS